MVQRFILHPDQLHSHLQPQTALNQQDQQRHHQDLSSNFPLHFQCFAAQQTLQTVSKQTVQKPAGTATLHFMSHAFALRSWKHQLRV